MPVLRGHFYEVKQEVPAAIGVGGGRQPRSLFYAVINGRRAEEITSENTREVMEKSVVDFINRHLDAGGSFPNQGI